MPRFKIDENLPKEVASLLEAYGYDALIMHEQSHAGTPDSELAKVCRSEERVIVTLDLDFSNVRIYPPEEHPGIIVLRLEHQDKETVLSVVTRMLSLLSVESLKEKLWIVEADRVRIWRHWE
jgi:predicted nuclease of predicted toxin-antitoxin system